MSLPSILTMAHNLIQSAVGPGDIAIDATAGNGHDTLFLARLVGNTGQVYSFDIQNEALVASKKRLQEAGLSNRVTFVHAGHEEMIAHIQAHKRKSPIRGIMFNLGYLPKGDPQIITRPASTLRALNQSLELLDAGGMITVVFYTGHPGGPEEARTALSFLESLTSKQYQIIRYEMLNRNHAPFLVAVSIP